MKYKIKLTLLTSLLSAVTAIADTIEIKDVGKKELEGGRTVFVKTEKIPTSNLYVGYRIELEKKADGKLHGHISAFSFEGFVTLDDEKMTPIVSSKVSDFIITNSVEEWSVISPTEGTKLEIRWIK